MNIFFLEIFFVCFFILMCFMIDKCIIKVCFFLFDNYKLGISIGNIVIKIF